MSLVYHLLLLLYNLPFVFFVLSVLLGVCWTYSLVRTSFTSRGYALPLYIALHTLSSSVVNFHIPDTEDVRIPFIIYFSVANSVTSTPCRV